MSKFRVICGEIESICGNFTKILTLLETERSEVQDKIGVRNGEEGLTMGKGFLLFPPR